MIQTYNQAEELYQRFVKPLEHKHRNQYAAVSPEGKTIFGSTVINVLRQAKTDFGEVTPLVFKVGQKVVGKWL